MVHVVFNFVLKTGLLKVSKVFFEVNIHILQFLFTIQ